QVEDPKKAKGIVRREVVRVVSPGTLTDASYLEAREPAFLLSVAPVGESRGSSAADVIGVALLDVSTGEFASAEYRGAEGRQALADELHVLKPREIVVPSGLPLTGLEPVMSGIPVTQVEPWTFEPEAARRTLLTQLRAAGLEGFGLDRHPAAVAAAGALVEYLRSTQKTELTHVRGISYRERTDALLMDPMTLRHLEVVEGTDGTRDGSLLSELDRTITSMGSRFLRSWLTRPLVSLDRIRDRLDAVEELAFRTTDRGKFRDALKGVQD